MAMTVVAKRGESSYLVDIGGDQGRVLDVEQKVFYPPMFMPSIIARGYWEPAEVDDKTLTGWLEGAEDRKAPPNLSAMRPPVNPTEA